MLESHLVGDLPGIAVIGGSIGALMLVLELTWRGYGRPRGRSQEVWRKAHHIGIGLIASFAHLWIDHAASGGGLALGFAALLGFAYRKNLLMSLFDERREQGKDPLYRKFRHSWIGPITYSLAVAAISFVYWDRPAIYRASLLILTLGDSAAAVIGIWLASSHYEIFGTRRSLEGNLALFSFASLTVGSIMDIGTPTGIVVALLMGLLLALVETISPFGLDNLTLPLMTGLVMGSIWEPRLEAFVVSSQLVAALGLVCLTALLLTVAHLHARALPGAALMLGCAAVALWDLERFLFVGILLVFLACTLLANRIAARAGREPNRAGLEIVARVAPCLGFVLGGFAFARFHGLAFGSLACVIYLGGAFWAEVLGPAASRRSTGSGWMTSMMILATTWSVLFLGVGVSWWMDLGSIGSTLFTVALAAVLGGGVIHVMSRSMTRSTAADLDGGLWVELVPAVIAVGSSPLVARVILGWVAG